MLLLDVTHYRSYTERSLTESLRLAGYSKMTFMSIPPLPVGFKGRFRNVAWRAILNPAIRGVMWICHGHVTGTIFSGNLLAIVEQS